MSQASLSRRRWSFSLRTMLIGLTMLGMLVGWLSYDMREVRRRQAIRNRLESLGAYVNVRGYTTAGTGPVVLEFRPAAPFRAISPFRRLMGDQTIRSIVFTRELTPLDQELIEGLPEAQVIQIPADSEVHEE